MIGPKKLLKIAKFGGFVYIWPKFDDVGQFFMKFRIAIWREGGFFGVIEQIAIFGSYGVDWHRRRKF